MLKTFCKDIIEDRFQIIKYQFASIIILNKNRKRKFYKENEE